MPAAYAHITIANLMRDRLDTLPNSLEQPYLKYSKYCELGAVSPDYPYLDITSSDSKKWADLMHYSRTVDFIKEGARLIKNLEGETKEKATAWLLGYASHVVADCVVHPVVNMIAGGVYSESPEIASAHRRCEMSQDLYIYRRLNMGVQEFSEHLDSGIKTCSHPDDPKRLDPDITKLWTQIFRNLHGDDYDNSPPELDAWHKKFCFVMDNLVEEHFRLIPFARHVIYEQGLTYPEEPRPEHINHIPTPANLMEYDQVFDKALDEVGLMWDKIAKAIFDDDQTVLAKLPNINLDTGLRTREEYYYWEGRA